MNPRGMAPEGALCAQSPPAACEGQVISIVTDGEVRTQLSNSSRPRWPPAAPICGQDAWCVGRAREWGLSSTAGSQPGAVVSLFPAPLLHPGQAQLSRGAAGLRGAGIGSHFFSAQSPHRAGMWPGVAALAYNSCTQEPEQETAGSRLAHTTY